MNTYRDRAAERRILHRGLGIGPGQKQSNDINCDEYEEANEDMDSLGAAPVDMNFCSSGLKSAKRIMENMGWKEVCVYLACTVGLDICLCILESWKSCFQEQREKN
jgi:hypothetical protein